MRYIQRYRRAIRRKAARNAWRTGNRLAQTWPEHWLKFNSIVPNIDLL